MRTVILLLTKSGIFWHLVLDVPVVRGGERVIVDSFIDLCFLHRAKRLRSENDIYSGRVPVWIYPTGSSKNGRALIKLDLRELGYLDAKWLQESKISNQIEFVIEHFQFWETLATRAYFKTRPPHLKLAVYEHWFIVIDLGCLDRKWILWCWLAVVKREPCCPIWAHLHNVDHLRLHRLGVENFGCTTSSTFRGLGNEANPIKLQL